MIALDKNIWLYSHDTRDPRKQALAQRLIATVRPLALPWQVGCRRGHSRLFIQGRYELQIPDSYHVLELTAKYASFRSLDLGNEADCLATSCEGKP